MAVPEPHLMNAAFADRCNARDVDGLLALYADDGSVVNPDGSVAVGREQLRAHLAGLLELGGRMESINRYAVVNGDVALIGAEYTIEFDDGRPTIAGRSAEVLRATADG